MHFKTLFTCVYIDKCCVCVYTHIVTYCKHLKYGKLPSGTHYCGCYFSAIQSSLHDDSFFCISLSHKIFLVSIQKYANKF